ncbi:MAG: hypothetical protein J7578_22810 [Chitinophagaceae bacterium]|nr:hypothetical protein [Chitinophagaceae bacterium]
MKKLIFIAAISGMVACKTVQKSIEEQVEATQSSSTSSIDIRNDQTLDHSEVKRTDWVSFSSSGNGFERVIEEQVLEYDNPDTSAPISNRVVQTNRVIKERGNSNVINVQQQQKQDSLKQSSSGQEIVSAQSNSDSTSLNVQEKKNVRRTGTPWYVWGGGVVVVSAALWWKGKKLRIGVSASKK